MLMNDLKAEFSQAYVRAVAHAAGFFVQEAQRMVDADGVDLTILDRGPGGVVRSPRLDVQLKATAATLEGDPFPFDLDAQNFRQLRDPSFQVPRILVVIKLPIDIDHWLSVDEEQLVMRHCGYWRSLYDQPETSNTASVRVHLPRQAIFHVEGLRGIMARVAERGLP